MRNPLFPARHYAASRRWAFWVNTVAASPYVGRDLRRRIYRRLGLDISPESLHVGFRCYFHSADISIGAGSYVNDYVYVENVERVTIGARVGIAPHVVILTSAHELGPSAERFGRWTPRPVTIEDGCWIGARSLILPGVRIGRGTLVAAGAVVTEDCEPSCLYGGVPAKMIRRLDE